MPVHTLQRNTAAGISISPEIGLYIYMYDTLGWQWGSQTDLGS